MRFNFRFFASGSAASNPAFRWLATGSSLNSAGMQGEQVIIGLLVYQLTGSSAWVGLSLALFFAPMLLVGVPAGAMADQYDKRKVLMATEVALIVCLSVFGILLIADKVTLETAMVMSLASGSLRALHHPARLSLAGEIAGFGGVVAALGLLSVVSRAGQLAGAISAGAIGEWFGAGSAYLLLASGHVLALCCFYRVTLCAQTEHRRQWTSIRTAIADYLQMLTTGGTVLLLIVIASLVEVFGFSFSTAMPEIAVKRLSIDAAGLGAMHSLRALGGLFGALLLSALIFSRLGWLYLAVIVGFGLALALLAVAPDFTTVLMAVAIVAAFASAADILVQSMLQLSVPGHLRGRAMGAWVVALGMGPVGHLELGLLIALFGTTVALGINGAVLILTGILTLVLCRSIRNFRDTAAAAANT